MAMNVLKGKLLIEKKKQDGIIVPDKFKDLFDGTVRVAGEGSELIPGDEVVFRRGGTNVKIHGIDYIYIDEKSILYVR
jgi:co-chaperonin GroES (HSP10)